MSHLPVLSIKAAPGETPTSRGHIWSVRKYGLEFQLCHLQVASSWLTFLSLSFLRCQRKHVRLLLFGQGCCEGEMSLGANPEHDRFTKGLESPKNSNLMGTVNSPRPVRQPGRGADKGRRRTQTSSVFRATVTPWSRRAAGRGRRTQVAELGSFLTFPTLCWLAHPATRNLVHVPTSPLPSGESDAPGLTACRLTVIMSFSTQSGATLWRWVRCSWRWILLLSMSWHRGQRSMGCTECCVMACTRSRLTSALLYLQ